MKVSCSNCKKSFEAPQHMAGKKVRCPVCKAPIKIPAAEPAHDVGFDLGSLDSMEDGGEAILREKGKQVSLKEAQAAAAAGLEGQPAPKLVKFDPTVRICPQCRERVVSVDIYGDLMCRNCGAAIPGLEIEQEETRYTTMSERVRNPVTFYNGFTSAVAYPIPSLGSIGLASVVALAVIALPVMAILGFTGASSANEVTREKTDFAWVGTTMMVFFLIEAIYFGAVGYYSLIDSIRTTTSGTEQPPPLTWSLSKLGPALGGYASLLGLYLVTATLLVFTQKGAMPDSVADYTHYLGRPFPLVILALLTFGVPMNLIGLSSTHLADGLNPVKVGPSIGRTIGHYIFLFLIVLLYMGFYTGVMIAVMNWAWPQLQAAAHRDSEASLSQTFLKVFMALVAWAVLVAAALYFAYVMGRVLGLFSRTYKEKLAFEL